MTSESTVGAPACYVCCVPIKDLFKKKITTVNDALKKNHNYNMVLQVEPIFCVIYPWHSSSAVRCVRNV
jgi:hypothetical protein